VATPIKKTAAPPAPTGINFGDLDMYVAGGGIPDGDYIARDFTVQMYQAKNAAGANQGPPRLGVMITYLPLADPKPDNERTQFYSMGGKADQSFAPNPETGKGLVAIPGAAGQTLNHSTNWAIYLKSLYDSGLPKGIFSNDLTPLDGVWVHVQNVPEPEERKGFAQSQTGEAAGMPQEDRKRTIAIVTEIKEGGMPWEGGGGVPTNGATPAAKSPAKAAPKPAPAAAAPAADTADTEDVHTAAIDGVSDVLTKKPNGCPRLALRTGTFNAVKAKHGEEMAGSVISTYFEGDASALANLLGEVGYTVEGTNVKQA
jgi:hypothetical protein